MSTIQEPISAPTEHEIEQHRAIHQMRFHEAEAELTERARQDAERLEQLSPKTYRTAESEIREAEARLQAAREKLTSRKAEISALENSIVQHGRLVERCAAFKAEVTGDVDALAQDVLEALETALQSPSPAHNSNYNSLVGQLTFLKTIAPHAPAHVAALEEQVSKSAEAIRTRASKLQVNLENLFVLMDTNTDFRRLRNAGWLDDLTK